MVFPTRVGVNRVVMSRGASSACVPHASGGEPRTLQRHVEEI